MKKTNIIYWIFTSLFAFMMLGASIPDVISHPVAVKGMHEDLGYPLYFIPFIGVAKVLGVIAILIPGYSRIKEWAYAGLIFDLIGATFSIIAVGKPDWIFMALPLTLGFGSYVFYHKRKKVSNVNEYSKSRREAFDANVAIQ
jgi:EamA domain-containing membrane protein RarD